MNKTLHCSSQIKKQHLVLPSTGLHNGNTVSRKENKSPYTTKKNATSYIYIYISVQIEQKEFQHSIPLKRRGEAYTQMISTFFFIAVLPYNNIHILIHKSVRFFSACLVVCCKNFELNGHELQATMKGIQ